MELRIKPYHKNTYPFGGLLIKHASVAFWMKALSQMQMKEEDILIYPIPGKTANTIWGCMVLTNQLLDAHIAGKHELCQRVTEKLFIPEKAILYPPMNDTEIDTLFNTGRHIIHPEFGLVELTDALNTKTLFLEPVMHSYHVTKPEDSVFIPGQIKSFQIKPINPEDLLENLEKKIFPQKETMKDESLSILEKGKLLFYKLLFTTNKKEKIGSEGRTGKSVLWAKAEAFFNSFSDKENTIGQKMQQDYEDLERRNQKLVDKFLDLLRNNPAEALKYAIPLDENGSVRGGNNSSFTLSRRWFDFSLFSSANHNTGSGSIDLGESANALRDQYNSTAQQLIKDKEFHKAAFIYMKLLKNHFMAAQTLEQGEYYQEAALIYLKHSLNKNKAAECYEKGKMTEDAITLYKELNQNEKVGDLYVAINKRKDADVYFEKVVNEYKNKYQFVKASLIYRNKMQDRVKGQALLLEGWNTNKDALNCLTNYFSNIEDVKILKNEITDLQKKNTANSDLFLQAIHHPYKRHAELSEWIREIAYEVIASQTSVNPNIVTEMKLFNKDDKHLLKDTFRFRLGKKI